MTTRSQTTCAHEMATAASTSTAESSSTATVATPQSPQRRQRPQVSLLERLKCPTKSELSRKRKIEKPTATTCATGSSAQANKKHKVGASNPTDPKNITPVTRVKEFPGEYLFARSGKLFCTICHEELALKKSTVKKHIESGDKHQKAKTGVAQKKAKEHDIAESLKAYDKEVHPAGTHISMEERVYRTRVVEGFLRAGIPLVKIDEVRGLLEEGSFRLTHSSHLSDCIPPILKSEKQSIRKEIEGKEVSVVFDGMSRLGEALAVVLRYCSG